MNATQETLTAPAPPPPHVRVRQGLRSTENWIQLFKFLCVGGTGYALNLAVFTLLAVVFDVHHLAAATIAFIVAVLNNFWLNRHWTFDAKEDHPVEQGARFFAISILAFGFTYVVLIALVDGGGLSKVLAQAIAIVAGTPLSFLGQKLWSFRA